ncbi:MAG: hypothetical protein RLZZ321_436, partial [Bacteroidota bacterium]
MKSLNFTRNLLSIFVLAFTFLIVGSVEGQATLPVNATFASATSSTYTLPTGFSQTGVASYNGALKFDTQGDQLILFFTGIPNTLSFDLGVNNSFSGTLPSGLTFSVFESENGISWNLISTYSAGNSLGTKSIQINGLSRYIQWTFTLKPSGYNVAIKNINVSKALEWTGGLNNIWSNTSNWSTGVIPPTTSNIVIPGNLA